MKSESPEETTLEVVPAPLEPSVLTTWMKMAASMTAYNVVESM